MLTNGRPLETIWLSEHDRDMEFVVEPGTFTVYAGGSSADVQEARFAFVDK